MATTKDLFNKLENNNFKISKYMYPDNLGTEEFVHAILISIYKRNDSSTQSSGNSRNISGLDVGSNQAKSFRTNNPVYASKKDLVGSTTRLTDTIALYMPKEISYDYSISYNNTDISQNAAFTKFISPVLPELKNLYISGDTEALNQKINNLLDVSAGDVKDKIKNFNPTQMISNIKNSVAQAALTQENVYTAISLFSKIARNPHMEYIFEKVGNRSFTFNFTFTPKNANETRNIDNIIRLLKRTAIPKVNEMTGSLGVYYDYPCVYDITFISNGKENQWIHKIATCILTSVKTDPTTESGFRAFNELDGKGTPPVKITLDLGFEEMESMSQQRIDEGY